MKKVLIITYYFPPSGGAGVQRVLKFVKYLPEFGWDPTVLTVVENAGFPTRDVSLLNEIPECARIVRTSLFEPYKAYQKFTGRSADQGMDIATLHQGRKSFKEMIAEWIRSTFFIPDARCFWKMTAVSAGKRLLKEDNYHIIFSSAPPYTTHLIGKKLARYSGKIWVADFRDSWVGWLSAAQRWWLPRMIELKMERSVLKQADHVTVAYPGIQRDLISRHDRVNASKWTWISNGFDQSDYKKRMIPLTDDPFVITYTGSLYGFRNPKTFLEGISKLREKCPDLADKLRVRFVGRVDPNFIREFDTFKPIIEYIPYVSHEQSINYLLSSHALLLIIDHVQAGDYIVPGKVFEYIGAQKPILALASDGETAKLIRHLRVGKVVGPDDSEGVSCVLAKWIKEKRGAIYDLERRPEMISEFERRNLSRKLALLFDSII